MGIYNQECVIDYMIKGSFKVYRHRFADHYLANLFEKMNPNIIIVTKTPLTQPSYKK